MQDIRNTVNWLEFLEVLKLNAEFIDIEKILEVMEEGGMIKVNI